MIGHDPLMQASGQCFLNLCSLFFLSRWPNGGLHLSFKHRPLPPSCGPNTPSTSYVPTRVDRSMCPLSHGGWVRPSQSPSSWGYGFSMHWCLLFSALGGASPSTSSISPTRGCISISLTLVPINRRPSLPSPTLLLVEE